jgi:hypothetical protein
MAARKKAAPKAPAQPRTVAPSAAPGALRRDRSNMPDPLDPSRPLVNRPPEFQDMTPALQDEIKTRIEDVGMQVYGAPITFDDAVRNRVESMERMVGRTRSGISRHHRWYSGHQGKVVTTAETAGANPASAADSSAILSQRNAPDNELRAMGGAVHIARNPGTTVNLTPGMVSDAQLKETDKTKLDIPLSPGVHRLGNLSAKQIAAVAQVGMELPDNVPSKVTDVYRYASVAGRPTQATAITAARGEPMDKLVGPAPKIRSYRRRMSTANPSEDAYNAEVLWRRRQNQTNPGQMSLFPASALLPKGFKPETATAEDYVMYYNTVKGAVAEGQGSSSTPASVAKVGRKAQDIAGAKLKKGKEGEGLPVDLDPVEAFHAFNNAVTQAASSQISATSILPDGVQVTESITPAAVQPMVWMEDRTYELGEDEDYNRQVNISKAFESAKGKLQSAQGFFDFSNPSKPVARQGASVYRKSKEDGSIMFGNEGEREALARDVYGLDVAHPDSPESDWHERVRF